MTHSEAQLPALFQAQVSQFLDCDVNAILGQLSRVASQSGSEVTAEQLDAWRSEIETLALALSSETCSRWHILLEFPIPRRGKRIDAVVLAGSVIIVLEFKCGAARFDRAARIQVEDYCLDLRDFHRPSRDRILVPVLVATEADEASMPTGNVSEFVAPTVLATATSLEPLLRAVAAEHQGRAHGEIDGHEWNEGAYEPTPSIIEAARVLYAGKDVHQITRCHAGVENLTKTSLAVVEAVRMASATGQKLICFVTGVPGSGKTLAGLNIVHSRDLHEGSLGVFLSGNGPLVRVLCEALARDSAGRTPRRIAEARREVGTFIQNVHRYIDAHFQGTAAPPDRCVIFDEAQRAWNREQSRRKFKRDRSEPEIILDIMNRHEGWAVVVALVGSGQEINTGEAGLREWGRAITECFPDWQVVVPPNVIDSGSTSDAQAQFDLPSLSGVEVQTNKALHLNVALRSYRAQAVSDFIAHVLNQDVEKARTSLALCTDFPIALTRELATAQNWLRSRQRGSRRVGLVASSAGRRLRAHGLDVRTELDVENWFLNPPWDIRSSYSLETPATEFGIQGLELDWTGVCWDIDLVPRGQDWEVSEFAGTKWRRVRSGVDRQYAINTYRVLLTRAREGMIIWVPNGSVLDETRPPERYDQVAEFLASCGIGEVH